MKTKAPARSKSRYLRRGLAAVACCAGMVAGAQAPVEQTADAAEPARIAVRGIVVNSATGEPLPHALVKLESEPLGALTDGEGHFEIAGVPTGDQDFEAQKPGFRGTMEVGDMVLPNAHAVRVAEGMPELKLALSPLNALVGQVTLSTGDPAVGIGLTLLRRAVENGHAKWNEINRQQTTPDGRFRFAGLVDGTYLLMTQPAFDNEQAAAPSCNGPAPMEVSGYPITFFGGGADASGAARIELERGQTGQANLTLTLSTFHLVRANPTMRLGPEWQLASTLLDANGVGLEYPLRDEEKNRTACAYLPDGNYFLTMDAGINDPAGSFRRRPAGKGQSVSGLLPFGVEGKAETHLRVAMAADVSSLVRVRYEPGRPLAQVHRVAEGDEEQDDPDAPPAQVSLQPMRGMGGRVESGAVAEWLGNDSFALDQVLPGQYWVQATANRAGTCVGTVSADGQNLAHGPWTASANGTGPAIDVVMRTDCAKLTVTLPSGVVDGPGEETSYFAYLVPEFDSATPVQAGMVQRSGDRSITLVDMTPGAYRVYLFDTPRELEYRNPEAMSRVSGHRQEVTLEPNGNATLVLELPQ